MPDIPYDVTPIEKVDPPHPMHQWMAFKTLCALLGYDPAALRDASAQLGLDLPAVKQYLQSQRPAA